MKKVLLLAMGFSAAIVLFACSNEPQLRLKSSADTSFKEDLSAATTAYSVIVDGAEFDVFNLKNNAATEYKAVKEGTTHITQTKSTVNGNEALGDEEEITTSISLEKGAKYTSDIAAVSGTNYTITKD